MKGQSAFEYLTTYSWAIIIVTILVGFLFYYSYLEPGVYLKSEAVGFSTFYISEGAWTLTTDRLLSIFAYNNVDHPLQVSHIYVENQRINSPVSMKPGEAKLLLNNQQLSTESVPGANYMLKIAIEYTDTVTGILHNDTGILIGKLEK